MVTVFLSTVEDALGDIWQIHRCFLDCLLVYILVKVKQCETGKAFICPAVRCMRRGGAGSRPLSLAHSEERQLRITTNYYFI